MNKIGSLLTNVGLNVQYSSIILPLSLSKYNLYSFELKIIFTPLFFQKQRKVLQRFVFYLAHLCKNLQI